MYQAFDHFGLFDKPALVLCNPDRSMLYALENITNVSVKIRYNNLSEVTFEAAKTVNDIEMEYYSLLEYKRIIYIENVGYFLITGIDDNDSGAKRIKTITAQSLEVELSYKRINAFTGTFQFYNYISPNGTLLGKILSYLPGWSIGTVDGELLSKYRTFDVSDQSIYNFLQQDCENAYGCIFDYDTIAKTISAYTITGATHSTDIFLSFDNLIKSTKLTEVTDELITALAVFGAGNLSINQVNPLGLNTIFNFSYFENTNWMDQTLIDALHIWEAKVLANQTIYADLLTQLEQANSDLLTMESDLVTLQGAMDALKEVQGARIQQGLDITAINTQIKAQQLLINAKNIEISAQQIIVSDLESQLIAINTDLSFDTNFTTEQQTALSDFEIGNTYNNTSFLQTDSMSLSEIQAEAQDLYDLAETVLQKVSQPKYTFDVESTNFLFLKEFLPFINQLQMGSVVTLEMSDGTIVYPIVLELDFEYTNPTSYKMIFGNRLRLDSASFIYSDIFGNSLNNSISQSFNSQQWGDWTKSYKDDVSKFINSALDASKNAVINASNQNIIIDGAGIRGRYLDPITNDYRNEQFWMINNMLVFTDDNWDTAKLALGEVSTPSGSAWGLVGDVIVGRILAGNELLITNEQSTFTVSGSNVTIVDGMISLNRSDGANKIYINPSVGIDIQSRNPSTGSYTDVFYIDTYGNLQITGNFQAATGTFSGAINALSGKIGAWTIDNYGLKDNNGNYIYGNGDVRLGMLTIHGNQAEFNGDIYADNLQGLVQYNQIGSVNADTIVTGTLSAIDIYGCNIYWPGVWMHGTTFGVSNIEVQNALNLIAGANYLFVTHDFGIQLVSNNIRLGDITATNNIVLMGTITTVDPYYNSGTGISGTFVL
jgi:hypothetical protein